MPAPNDQDPSATPPKPGTEGGQSNGGQAPNDQSPKEEFEWSGRKLTKEQFMEEVKKMQTDYTRKSQLLSQIEKEREETPASEEPKSQLTAEQKAALRASLKEIGVTFREDLDREKAAQRVTSERQQLEAKYDGADGKPKFEFDKCLEFAVQHKLPNLEIAYKELNEEKLDEWKLKQKIASKPPFSESPSINSPKDGALSDKDIDKMSSADLEKLISRKTFRGYKLPT